MDGERIEEKLREIPLFYKPEIEIAYYNEASLFTVIDMFNNQIGYYVRYGDGYETEIFYDYNKACEVFMESISMAMITEANHLRSE